MSQLNTREHWSVAHHLPFFSFPAARPWASPLPSLQPPPLLRPPPPPTERGCVGRWPAGEPLALLVSSSPVLLPLFVCFFARSFPVFRSFFLFCSVVVNFFLVLCLSNFLAWPHFFPSSLLPVPFIHPPSISPPSPASPRLSLPRSSSLLLFSCSFSSYALFISFHHCPISLAHFPSQSNHSTV